MDRIVGDVVLAPDQAVVLMEGLGLQVDDLIRGEGSWVLSVRDGAVLFGYRPSAPGSRTAYWVDRCWTFLE